MSLLTCSSKRTVTSVKNKKNENTIESSVRQRVPIAPEFCRIEAVIVQVQEPSATEKPPCDKYPCYARVKVLTVLGVGSSFSPMLQKAQEVNLYFACSLGETKKAFPDQEMKPFPGLKKSDMFIADIEGNPFEQNKVVYKVYSYDVVKSIPK